MSRAPRPRSLVRRSDPVAWLVVAPSMRARALEWPRRIRDVSHDLVRIISHPSLAGRNIPVTSCDFPLRTGRVDFSGFIFSLSFLCVHTFFFAFCVCVHTFLCSFFFYFLCFRIFLLLACSFWKIPFTRSFLSPSFFNYRSSALFPRDPLCRRPTHAIEQNRSL